MLVLTLRVNDSVELWEKVEGGENVYLGRILVTRDESRQERLRIGFDLDKRITILRPEVSDGRGNFKKL